MTGERLKPRPLADLTPENLRVLVEDLEGPGWYSSADLYGYYLTLVRRDGLEPVSAKAFGGALRALGYRASTRRVGGVPSRGWMITQRAFRGGTPDNPGGTHPDRVAVPLFP
jgi:hypothetical protein